MSKFKVELTSEQVVGLSAIATSIIIGDYKKLDELRDMALSIAKATLSAESLSPEFAVIKKSQCSEVATEIAMEDEQSSYIPEVNVKADEYQQNEFVPSTFFNTYNSAVEQHNGNGIINLANECIRFGFGKQGQVAIQFWADYPGEVKNPDSEFYINAQDIVCISRCIDKITQTLFFDRDVKNALPDTIWQRTLPYCKKVSVFESKVKVFIESSKKTRFQVSEVGYEIEVNTDITGTGRPATSSAIISLTKRKDGDITIPFFTSQQIILFNEFLKYHLNS